MTTAKEVELKQKYCAENGTKKTVIDTTFWEMTNREGTKINTDYYKLLSLDFYLWLLDQIPD